MKTLANMYRLPMVTTPECLASNYHVTVEFGNRVMIVGFWYSFKSPCYYGAVYEHTDNNLTCEGEVKLVAISEKRFVDDGHAMKWALAQ